MVRKVLLLLPTVVSKVSACKRCDGALLGGRRLRFVHVAAFALRIVVRELQRGPFEVQLASPGSTRGEGDGAPPPANSNQTIHEGSWLAHSPRPHAGGCSGKTSALNHGGTVCPQPRGKFHTQGLETPSLTKEKTGCAQTFRYSGIPA